MSRINKVKQKFRIPIKLLVVTAAAVISFSFADDYFEVAKNLDIYASVFREVNIYYVD